MYIAGHLGRGSGREIFPLGEVNTKTLIQLNEGKSQGQRVLSPNGLSVTLCGNAGGQGGKTGLYLLNGTNDGNADGKDVVALVKIETKLGYDPAIRGDGINLDSPGKYRRGRVAHQETNTVLTSGGIGTIDGFRIRRLTPIECERLQAFPDDWTKYGDDGRVISDSQRYKCCGNAVTTSVITGIFNNWEMV